MLKIEKFVTPSPEQWEITIEGMRNAMNSWDRMDSKFGLCCDDISCKECPAHGYDDCPARLEQRFNNMELGENDRGLMLRLNKGGAPHAKYRRMLPVHVTVNAPLYWWKEFETYRVGVASNPSDIEFNSCSTMHRIHAKEFTLEDFSHEHLDQYRELTMYNPTEYHFSSLDLLKLEIQVLNQHREHYLDLKAQNSTHTKRKWWQMIQLLPTSYNQKRTIYLNYQVLYEIYEWRRNHKLDEWHTFCHWIEELPYSELIIGEVETDGE